MQPRSRRRDSKRSHIRAITLRTRLRVSAMANRMSQWLNVARLATHTPRTICVDTALRTSRSFRLSSSASLASRAAATALADDDNDEAHDDDEQHEPVWRQLDDVLTTAGFGQVRASTAPSACSSLLLDGLGVRSV